MHQNSPPMSAIAQAADTSAAERRFCSNPESRWFRSIAASAPAAAGKFACNISAGRRRTRANQQHFYGFIVRTINTPFTMRANPGIPGCYLKLAYTFTA